MGASELKGRPFPPVPKGACEARCPPPSHAPPSARAAASIRAVGRDGLTILWADTGQLSPWSTFQKKGGLPAAPLKSKRAACGGCAAARRFLPLLGRLALTSRVPLMLLPPHAVTIHDDGEGRPRSRALSKLSFQKDALPRRGICGAGGEEGWRPESRG